MRLDKSLLLSVVLLMPVAAMAGTLPARQPGMWQSVTNVTDASGAPLPKATNIVTVSCVDPATDIKFLLSGTSRCGTLKLQGHGSDYKITGACKDELGKTVQIDETLDYASAQSVQLTAVVASEAGPLHVSSQLT
jgi:hypothetical protein